MIYEITGTCIWAGEVISGLNKKNEQYSRQDFVIKENSEQQRKYLFRTFNESIIVDMDDYLKPEKPLLARFRFEIDAHEYNGKWYTDLICKFAEPIEFPAREEAQESVKQGDLPFE